MSDPDRFAWRDLDLAADLAAEAETVAPPPGARERVLEGILVAAAAGTVAGLSGTAAAAGLEAASTSAAASTAAGGIAGGGVAGGSAGLAATSATVTTATVGGTAAVAGGGLIAKGILAAALVGGGATVTWQAVQPEDEPRSSAELAQPAPRTETPRRRAETPRAPDDPLPPRSLPPSPATEAAPLSVATPPRVMVGSAAPSPTALTVPLSPTSTPARPRRARRAPAGVDASLRTETSMMRAARAALRARRWADAKRVLDLHARRFRRGAHREEREALRVLRLQRMRSPRAEAALAAFVDRFKHSLYLRMLGR